MIAGSVARGIGRKFEKAAGQVRGSGHAQHEIGEGPEPGTVRVAVEGPELGAVHGHRGAGMGDFGRGAEVGGAERVADAVADVEGAAPLASAVARAADSRK